MQNETFPHLSRQPISPFLWPVYFIILFFSLHQFAYCRSIPTVALIADSTHINILHRIEAALFVEPKHRPILVRLETEQIQRHPILEKGNFALIVAIGPNATFAALNANQRKPVLSILVRKNEYEDLIAKLNTDKHTPTCLHTVLYLDQPYSRQLQLAKLLMPKLEGSGSVGVVLGPSSKRDIQPLQKYSNEFNIPLSIVHVSQEDNPIEIVDSLLVEAKLLLAVPDNIVFNPRASRGLLLAAYRKQVPIIGYSKSYVNNGALAAIYATPKQLAKEVAKEIMFILEHPSTPLPAPKYLSDFSVAINYQVARSLGIELESEAKFKQKILEFEKGHV